MKKLLSAMLCSIMILSVFSFSCPIWADSDIFAGGTGTYADPYTVETAAQLYAFASSVNTGTTYVGKYVALVADIKLNDISNFSQWDTTPPKNRWTPIGNIDRPFSGFFYGNGHTISGIYVNRTGYYNGLFGCVSSGGVRDTGIARSYISGGSYTGAVVGHLKSTSYISDCFAKATVKGSDATGGLIGCVSESTVTRGFTSGSVTGYSYCGGIAGRSVNGTVSECYSACPVSGVGYVCGVVGANSGAVTNCYYIKTDAVNTNLNGAYPITDDASGGLGTGGGETVIDWGSLISTTDKEGVTMPLTDTALQSSTSYAGFEFSAYWTINTNGYYKYPTLSAVGPAVYNMGDVSHDGKINTLDARIALSVALCPEDYTEDILDICDIDFSISVTTSDARNLLLMALSS